MTKITGRWFILREKHCSMAGRLHKIIKSASDRQDRRLSKSQVMNFCRTRTYITSSCSARANQHEAFRSCPSLPAYLRRSCTYVVVVGPQQKLRAGAACMQTAEPCAVARGQTATAETNPGMQDPRPSPGWPSIGSLCARGSFFLHSPGPTPIEIHKGRRAAL
jgi:hypothetical protein